MGTNISAIYFVLEVANLQAWTKRRARSTILDEGASVVAVQELGTIVGMRLHAA